VQLAALIRPVVRLHHASRNEAPLLSISFVVDAEVVAKEKVELAAVVVFEPLLLGSGVRRGAGTVVGLHLGGVLDVLMGVTSCF
jgi:hypothetical protein